LGIATAIRITDGRKKGLLRRARRRKTTLEDELNSAIDLYLQLPPDVDMKDLEALAREANASLGRSIAKLDEAIATVEGTRKELGRIDRRLDELA